MAEVNGVKQFRFYITDTFEGRVIGTDDAAMAADFASSCDYYVVDTATAMWLQEEGGSLAVQEAGGDS